MGINFIEVYESPTFRLLKKDAQGEPVVFKFEFSDGVFVCKNSMKTNYNASPTDDQADTESLQSDWTAIGKDINQGIEEYKKIYG